MEQIHQTQLEVLISTPITTLEAIDFTGKRVQTILDGKLPEGQFTTQWNVTELPAGIYHVRIVVEGSGAVAKKVVVL
ncbi:MAG: T9SS type A sorting domain-containing protein [Bacteroidales bacterium]|nr:T9SS type A sorting domain-containing protein [Bacteroidales bacterium]